MTATSSVATSRPGLFTPPGGPDAFADPPARAAPNTFCTLEGGVRLPTPPIRWVRLQTLQADANGLIEFTDWHAQSFPTRFYRLVMPASVTSAWAMAIPA